MIYYIKHFKRIKRTCTKADVEISKIRDIYHQRDMGEYHKNPKVVPTVDLRDCPKTLETVDDYIRGFKVVDAQPLRYGLREDCIAPVVAHDPTYPANGSKYFTNDEYMIVRGSIISGHAVLGTDPEEIGPFTKSFITDKVLIWDKMVAIF